MFMAVMKGGLLYGRVGTQLYYVRNGKQLVRSVSQRKGKTVSSKLSIQQTNLAMVTQFLSPLKEIVRQTCVPYHNKMSGMNRAVSQVFGEALIIKNESYIIDPSKVKVSRGSLTMPLIIDFKLEDRNVFISWTVNSYNNYLKVYLIAYNVKERVIQLSNGGEIYHGGQLSMMLNEEIVSGTFHLYAYLSNRMGTSFSDSVYLGEF